MNPLEGSPTHEELSDCPTHELLIAIYRQNERLIAQQKEMIDAVQNAGNGLMEAVQTSPMGKMLVGLMGGNK